MVENRTGVIRSESGDMKSRIEVSHAFAPPTPGPRIVSIVPTTRFEQQRGLQRREKKLSDIQQLTVSSAHPPNYDRCCSVWHEDVVSLDLCSARFFM
ncbi:hypothetical protein SNOG_07038 [Parastagonospora nodorum SN15]|uniref:Uncharacterized protein n=1 Tax=Phaeosphaeria nodorum (strain SN15 / ATCC MYA-4574 / FGSC 10173) TaxID=321614 RepID=Q0UMH6_PHANO|nr:hypothetical protein SNOG_07038 [Parastagonospora nodorum SN15]EAT85689.1 hypothetical protein SNOG_07038 [Parastagonospora nodorum SN15]